MRTSYKTIGELNDASGFFTRYKDVNSTNFILLFGDLTENEIIDLDNLLTDVQGEKILLEKWQDVFEKQNAVSAMNRIVKTANLLHFDAWKAIKDAVDAGLETDVTKPLTETETIEQTTSNENENGETVDNKVYGFDSQTASDDTTSETTGSSSDSGSLDRTKTTAKSNGKLASENAKKVIDFARYNDYLNIVINDISEIMGLAVY